MFVNTLLLYGTLQLDMFAQSRQSVRISPKLYLALVGFTGRSTHVQKALCTQPILT